MRALRDAFIVDAVRTPIARYKGALATVRPDDLAAHILSALAQRNPALVERLDHVVFGATNQAGEDNRNVGRMAALIAKLPFEVPALTVNRLCGSGLEAVCDAVRRIETGDADVVAAGGVESMTRAPFAFAKTEEAFSRMAPKVFDTTLGWRFENPKLEERFQLLSMGETAEEVAVKWSIGRQAQDAFAVESQKKAAAAMASGAFDREIVAVPVPQKKGEPTLFAKDESPRADTTLEALSKLPAAFRKGGTVTAGTSSPLHGGAAGLLLGSERRGGEVAANKLEPLWPGSWPKRPCGSPPQPYGRGPHPAGRKRALALRDWSAFRDVDLVELNEASSRRSPWRASVG